MFVRTDDAPEALSDIELKLLLPDSTEVTLHARVVHVITPEQSEAYGRPAGMGVEFVHVDAEQKRQILQLVEFARAQSSEGADPNATFTRALQETAASIPARDVGSRLSMLPDSNGQDPNAAARAAKASRVNLPAVQIEDGAANDGTPAARAVRPPPRAPSQPLDPEVFRAAQRQITRAATGPVTPAARSTTNMPAVRAPSAPLQGAPPRSTTNMPAVRAPSAPLQGALPRSTTNMPAVRAPSAPLDPATARSSMSNPAVRAPSSPNVRTPTGPLSDPASYPARAASGPISASPDSSSGAPLAGSNSGPAPSPSGQPQSPPKPTDVNRLKLVMNALAHKHYEDAARMAREMLADNPGDPQVLKWQAICFARMALARNDAAAAAEQYEKALRYDENNREARDYVRAYQRERKLNSLPFGRYFTKKK